MTRIKRNEWMPQGICNLEKNALEALRETNKCISVRAGPGAGKTEFLAQKATYLLQTGICPAPKRILAISFKKDAARTLAERVEKRCPIDQARRFDSMTFDAFTKSILDRFSSALPDPYKISRSYQIGDLDFKGFLNRHGVVNANNAVLSKFKSSIALTSLPINSIDKIEDQLLVDFWKEALEDDESVILSFSMINRLVKMLLETNPKILRALRETYLFVFLDEFQDTTNAQYDLMTVAFGGCETMLTAVGDNKQRIMGWAGAMTDAFDQFERDFDADKFSLNINWRSHKGLVCIQNAISGYIDQKAGRVKAARQIFEIKGDICSIWRFDNSDVEAKFLSKWVSREIRQNSLGVNDIVILVRNKPNECEEKISSYFEKENIKVRNMSRTVGGIAIQDLLSEELTQIFISLFRLGLASRSPKNWEIVRQMYLYLENADPDNDLAQEKLMEKLQFFICTLRLKLNQLHPNLVSAEILLKMILDFLGKANLKRCFPAYGNEQGFARVWGGFVAFLKECVQGHGSWQEALDEFEGIGQVPLMTIHKSKGLEFHTVIFYGLDDQSWWSLNRKEDEEVRAFFVAFTRARDRVFFTRSSNLRGPIKWIEELLDKEGVRVIDGTTILQEI